MEFFRDRTQRAHTNLAKLLQVRHRRAAKPQEVEHHYREAVRIFADYGTGLVPDLGPLVKPGPGVVMEGKKTHMAGVFFRSKELFFVALVRPKAGGVLAFLEKLCVS